ncbi:hypothetical protein M0811_07873 [Anaeramoeba ignava]|uniref:C2 domain-containing protein n=1 Tax=Anaeramoeba ignava TaxID=1746090 RepID=A0A9Q0LLQ4_ANAIG|nr:hypothetical protein M0811_07873 [Anaeramoeba ignava]
MTSIRASNRIKYPSWLFITIKRAIDLTTEANILKDCYCILWLEDQEFKSKTVFQTNSPIFNETFRFGVLNPEIPVKIDFYDFESFTNDHRFGFIEVSYSDLEDGKSYEKIYKLQGSDSNSAMVHVVITKAIFDSSLFQDNVNLSPQTKRNDIIDRIHIINEAHQVIPNIETQQKEQQIKVDSSEKNIEKNIEKNEIEEKNYSTIEIPQNLMKSSENQPIELEFVYGYKATNSRNNLHFTSSGEIIYFAAAIPIIYNLKTKTQKFFYGHSSEIICNAIHPSRQIFATGDSSEKPLLCVWGIGNSRPISYFSPPHDSGIYAVTFSKDGTLLASVGLDDNHTICIWDWENNKLICSKSGHPNKVLCLECDPKNNSKFVTCGISHIRSWELSNDNLSFIEGSFGDKEIPMLLSLAVSKNNEACVGTPTGEILVWDMKNNQLTNSFRAHTGPCIVIRYTSDESFLLSGGKDGKVVLWDSKTKERKQTISSIVGGPIRAVDYYQGKIITGSAKHIIWETDLSTGNSTKILISHSNEVWGLASHPKKQEFVTACDDRSVQSWDAINHKPLSTKRINGQARYVNYSPDGELLGIGLRDGELLVVRSDNYRQVSNRKDMTTRIVYMKFSLNLQNLVIAYEDGSIDLYVSYRRSFTFHIPLPKDGMISVIDFSKDQKKIQVLTNFEKRFFFDLETNQMITTDTVSGLEEPQTWEINDCLIPQNLSGFTSIDQYKISSQRLLIAYTDNTKSFTLIDSISGNIKKFDIQGHSSNVVNVKFLHPSKLISIGGEDHCIFQWKILN